MSDTIFNHPVLCPLVGSDLTERFEYADRMVETVASGLSAEFDIAPKYGHRQAAYEAIFLSGSKAWRESLREVAEFATDHELELIDVQNYLEVRGKDGKAVADLKVGTPLADSKILRFTISSASAVTAAGIRDQVTRLARRFGERNERLATKNEADQSSTPPGSYVYHGPVIQGPGTVVSGTGNTVSSVSGSPNSTAQSSTGTAATPSVLSRVLRWFGSNLVLAVVTIVATVVAGLILANIFDIGL